MDAMEMGSLESIMTYNDSDSLECLSHDGSDLCMSPLKTTVASNVSPTSVLEYRPDPPYPPWAIAFLGLLAGCTSLVTVSGNMIVILSFFLDRTIRQPTNYFIASLAVSDLLIGAISMPFYTIYLLTGYYWPLGEILCDLWLSIDYTACLCSIYTVFCITVDRFCSVKIPAKYRNWRSERKVLVAVACTWVIPALVFFPSIFGWQCLVGERTVPKGKCYVQYMDDALFNCFLQVGYFWVTIIAMFGLYTGIYGVALRLQRRSEAKQARGKAVLSTGASTGDGGIHKSNKDNNRKHGENGLPEENEKLLKDDGGANVIDTEKDEEEANCDSPINVEEIKLSIFLSQNCSQTMQAPDFGQADARMLESIERLIQDPNDDSDQHTRPALSAESIGRRVCESDKREPPSSAKTEKKIKGGGDIKSDRESLDGLDKRQVEPGKHQQHRSEHPSDDDDDSESGDDKRPAERKAKDAINERSLLVYCSGNQAEPSYRSIVYKNARNDLIATSSCCSPNSCKRQLQHDAAGVSQCPSVRNSGSNNSSSSMQGYRQMIARIRLIARRSRKADSTSRRWPTRGASDGNKFGSSGGGGGCCGCKEGDADGNCGCGGNCNLDSASRRSDHSTVLTASAASGQEQIELKPTRSCRTAPADPQPAPAEEGTAAAAADDSAAITTTIVSTIEQIISNRSSLRLRNAAEVVTGCESCETGGGVVPESVQSALRRLRGKITGSDSASGNASLRSHPDTNPHGAGTAAEGAQKNKRVNRARKALRTITIILGAFVVCWIPWHVLSLIIGFCPKDVTCIPPILYDISYWLCYLNSPINPFCYALANQQFKKAFARILRLDWQRM